MLDSDLAVVYGVLTERLNEQVRRNRERFPADFAFRLTAAEYVALLPQIAGAKKGRGGRRSLPFVFTEHGALMAANVLKSSVAIQTSIQVVRALSRLRELLVTRKLEEMEKKYDSRFSVVFDALRELMAPRQSRRGEASVSGPSIPRGRRRAERVVVSGAANRSELPRHRMA